MTLLKKKAEVLAFIIILPHLHLSMSGGLALASDNMTRINIKFGGTGVTFLLNQIKCVNIFFL